MRHAVIVMQSAVRCSRACESYMLQRRAATAVQAAARGFFARRAAAVDAAQTARAVVTVQAMRRGVATRRMLMRLNAASTVIQTQHRSWTQSRSYAQMRHAVIVMQSAVRCSRACESYMLQR
eukprot:COSAG06_NODE_41780_length_387_cov_5.541667_1_plen_121_part_01